MSVCERERRRERARAREGDLSDGLPERGMAVLATADAREIQDAGILREMAPKNTIKSVYPPFHSQEIQNAGILRETAARECSARRVPPIPLLLLYYSQA